MRKFLLFLGGVITGVVLTVVFALVVSNSQNSSQGSISGLTFMDTPGQVMEAQSYKVLQVIENGYALTHARSNDFFDSYSGILVLVLTDDPSEFYDDKIIKTPAGKCFRQVGTYQYETKAEIWKTVPAIALFDK